MATAAGIPYGRRVHPLDLAKARGYTVCSWAARAIDLTLGENGELVNAAWRIDSASSATNYVVTYTAAGDHVECECLAAKHHRPCWHTGLGLMLGHYLAALYSPEGRVEASSIAKLAAIAADDARCLGY